MNKLLLLLFVSFTLVSCLKEPEEPQPIICLTEPTIIGKWEQISFSEKHYNKDREKTKENTIEFTDNDEKASKIEILAPKDEDFAKDEESARDNYLVKGDYLATVYDEEAKKTKDIKGIYKILYLNGINPVEAIEIEVDDQSTTYAYKIGSSTIGITLTLTKTTIEGENEDEVLIETVLTFKAKS